MYLSMNRKTNLTNMPPLGQDRRILGERQRCNLLEIGYFINYWKDKTNGFNVV